MAEQKEDRSKEDLSEEASPYRIEEMRRKGQVAQSREVTGMVALLAAGATLYGLAPHFVSQIAEFMREVFSAPFSSRIDLAQGASMKVLFTQAGKLTLVIVGPVFGAALALGLLTSFAQVGSIFSTDPITPDWSKIDPLKGLQKMLSRRMLVEGFRLVLKASIVVAVAYTLLKTQILESTLLSHVEPQATLTIYGQGAKEMFLALFAILLVFAGLDYFLQRDEYQKNVRLTKQEAKQEHKEKEGDPQIRARVRAIQRDMARKRMMAAVKKADVVITNPTHIAVAIEYDREGMAAPKVIAKGADFVAQRIKQIAADAGVPTVENVPLARTLYKTVKVGQQIPRALYQAVAEVLAYVYRLKNRRL
jgi:flagellar biosynthetic protein FlhB